MKNTEMKVTKDIKLLEFLYENVEGMSKNNIKNLLKRENIIVNGNIKKQFDLQLKVGDTVSVSSKKIADRVSDVEIIYDDKDFFVINKPYGLLTVVAEDTSEKTAFKIVNEYARKNGVGKLHVLHRLDKETSGVLVFTKSDKLKNCLQDDWNDLVTKRGYIALVEGKVEKKEDRIVSYLAETKTKVMYATENKENGKEAITNYKVIKQNSKYSLLTIDIETGRKNQIRVHLKDMGHPIIGDKKYNSKTNPIKRLGLHANSLEIRNPLNDKVYNFEAEIPREFKALFEKYKK